MQEWNALIDKFTKVTDRLGMPIDTDIFETVVALNALGITTTQSCGGHIDERGFLLPWVDIEMRNPTSRELHKQYIIVSDEVDKLQREVKGLREKQVDLSVIEEAQTRVNEKYEERHLLNIQIRMQQCAMRDRLVDCLSRFYEGRVVSFDRRLILHRLGNSRTRMENQGAHDFYLGAPLDIQQQKLAEYQEEMRDFTRFLKHIYFSQRTENPLP
ncbi:hypothetical protein [Ktedonobacter racemifer]|uniref:Uncharacterized protein n=1 Tax=Ktedonobacter racemifer DSM 44963 TaxID=485913 RepID=D6TY46_KTERA|nr:hypothetical protein [Ktedonobacter racemifer]EFH85042.1 hypothetical protein Krac_6182 [Ktedonobacter racemifer DSM 44963]